MDKKGHSEEQIVAVLRQVEGGERLTEMPQEGISQASYYLWKRQYAGLGEPLVADLSVDRQILQEIVSKKL